MDQPTVGRRNRGRAYALAAALLSATVLGSTVAPSVAHASAPDGLLTVIVEGGGDAATRAVLAAGGTVDRQLAVVDGLVARIPATGLGRVAAADGVRRVTPDSSVHVLEDTWGDDTTREDEKASAGGGRWQANKDRGSTNRIARAIGVHATWDEEAPHDEAELTGAGVGVALLDTGVTPVKGLSNPGKVVNGPDLSFDSQSGEAPYLDHYGHGTHMAGLIAGNDDRSLAPDDLTKPRFFAGMAPGATLVNVKVGASDGSVDVSQVIAGIDWVVSHRAAHDIRVLNLSFGTESTQSYLLDPLAHAVESAWRAGIVVVVAAGNDGDSGGTALTMPAADPYVIAVGSADHRGRSAVREWAVGHWTNPGTDARRPDLLAPGKSVVSLRDPGSVADREHPEGRVRGDRQNRFFRGTGTSQSAAIVSGAAALLLQRNPELTPDQVKGVLMAGAERLVRDGRPSQGAGVLDVERSVELLADRKAQELQTYAQSWPRSTGTGSLDASRGDGHLVDPATGAELRGEVDIFGRPWDAQAWASAAAAGTAWSGGTWRGVRMAADAPVDGSWPVAAWSAPSWGGVHWADQPWERVSWRADDWSRVSWRGGKWSRVSWRAADYW